MSNPPPLAINLSEFLKPKQGETTLEDVIRILFGGALENGVREIDWRDVPALMGNLQRAGLKVEGDYEPDDFGRGPAVIKVSVHLKVIHKR